MVAGAFDSVDGDTLSLMPVGSSTTGEENTGRIDKEAPHSRMGHERRT